MLAERLKAPLNWTRTGPSTRGFLLSKGNWNSSNEQKIHYADTVCANCILGGKKSFCTYCIQLYLFDFSLKGVIKSTVCTTEGLGWCNCIFDVSTVSFSLPFVSHSTKPLYYNDTSCKSISYFSCH